MKRPEDGLKNNHILKIHEMTDIKTLAHHKGEVTFGGLLRTTYLQGGL